MLINILLSSLSVAARESIRPPSVTCYHTASNLHPIWSDHSPAPNVCAGHVGSLTSCSITCHTKCAEKSVKTMTSYQETIWSLQKIEKWKTYKFWLRIWKCHQIQLLTTFCNQKKHCVVFQHLCIKQHRKIRFWLQIFPKWIEVKSNGRIVI